MLIYDKYTEEYYNVIPVKNVEEKIKELEKEKEKYYRNEKFIIDGVNKDMSEGFRKDFTTQSLVTFSIYNEILGRISILQQLIKENTEEE